jgi:hypothetical protein
MFWGDTFVRGAVKEHQVLSPSMDENWMERREIVGTEDIPGKWSEDAR